MNQQKSPHALSSLFTIIGLVLLIGGAGVWMWLNQSDTQTVAGTANSTTSDVSALLPSAHPVADVGTPLPSLLASKNSQGVVHLTNWSYDLKKAFAQSKASGKPVLMLLTADWCGPCQMLKESVLALPGVDEMVKEKFTPVVWDLTDPSENEIKLMEIWEANGAIPEMLMFDATGNKPVKSIVGVVPQREFEMWLKG